MTRHGWSEEGLVLSGLDGANPLAFLAAVGALRGLTLACPERRLRLSWVPLSAWRPVLHVEGEELTQEAVLEGLERFLEMRPGHQALEIGDDLTIQSQELRKHALAAAEAASPAPEGRAMPDFISAFGCDAIRDRKGLIKDTALRTLSGAGNQHFLKSMRELATKTTKDALQRCLFSPWKRQDPRLSLRWDPEDDRRYALRWRDPTAEATRTEWGANRLAFEALPLFPVAPVGRTLATTGFTGSGSRDTFWTWPIWEAQTDLDTLRSLLALRQLQETVPDRAELAAMGVREVFRSQRLTVGKYRNFSPARPV